MSHLVGAGIASVFGLLFCGFGFKEGSEGMLITGAVFGFLSVMIGCC